jgi:hypothetical protein
VVPMRACGGLYASADDMTRFIQFHINQGRVEGKQILASDLLNEMYTVPWPEEGQVSGYGLGLALMRRNGLRLFGHSGGGFGFLSDVYWYPDLGMGVVFLTNANEHHLQWQYIMNIMDRMMQLPEYRGQEQSEAEAGSQPKEVEVPAPLHLAGQYVAWPGDLVIEPVENGLGIRFNKSSPISRLSFSSPNRACIQVNDSNRQIRFESGKDGHPTYLVWLHDGRCYDYNGPSSLQKPDDKIPIKANEMPHRSGKDYPGLYSSPDGGLYTRVIQKKDRLYWKWLLFGPPLYLDEYQPGLFFTCTGEALDFTGQQPILAGIPAGKATPGPFIRQGFGMAASLIIRTLRRRLTARK